MQPDIVNGYLSALTGFDYYTFVTGWAKQDPAIPWSTYVNGSAFPVNHELIWVGDPPPAPPPTLTKNSWYANAQTEPVRQQSYGSFVGPVTTPRRVHRLRMEVPSPFTYSIPMGQPNRESVLWNASIDFPAAGTYTDVVQVWLEDPATGQVLDGTATALSVSTFFGTLPTITQWPNASYAGLTISKTGASNSTVTLELVPDGDWTTKEIDLVFAVVGGAGAVTCLFGTEPFVRRQSWTTPPKLALADCKAVVTNAIEEATGLPPYWDVEGTIWNIYGPDVFFPWRTPTPAGTGQAPLTAIPATGQSSTPVTVNLPAVAGDVGDTSKTLPVWTLDLPPVKANEIGFLEMDWTYPATGPFGLILLTMVILDQDNRLVPTAPFYQETTFDTPFSLLLNFPFFSNPLGLARFDTEDPYGGMIPILMNGLGLSSDTVKSIFTIPGTPATASGLRASFASPLATASYTLQSLVFHICGETWLRQFPRDDDLGMPYSGKGRMWAPGSNNMPTSRQRSQRQGRHGGTYL